MNETKTNAEEKEEPEVKTAAKEEDEYELGWRYVWEKGEDGFMQMVQRGLTQEDVLHPLEEDFIVQNDYHDEDVGTLKNALKQVYAGRDNALIRVDGRTDFQVAGVRPLGPDLGVFENLDPPFVRGTGTFMVKDHNADPVLVVEVTSPTTRMSDLDRKPDLYFQAGVPFLAIVDYVPEQFDIGNRILRLLGFRAEPGGYVPVPLDAQGRLWIDPVCLWLVAEGDHLVCLDAQGRRIPTFLEARQQAAAAEEVATKAKEETTKAKEETTKAKEETTKAKEETTKAKEEVAKAKEDAVKEADARKAAEAKLSALMAALSNLPDEQKGNFRDLLLTLATGNAAEKQT